MSETLPSPSFRPLYEQIKILLTQSLVAGEWKPGEAIPSEMELAARFRVSQGTVRQTSAEPASEHILVRRQGKGTFVATHTEPSYQYRFLRVMPDSGEKLTPPVKLREKHPTGPLVNAVKRMLPRSALGRQMMTKLKVYAGDTHPHAAQKPQPLVLSK